MTPKLLLPLAFMGMFTSAHAQSKVRFGIKAGFNFPHFNASVIAPPLQSVNDDNYFYAGGQVEVRFNKHFSLQPEFFYVGHSVKENVTAFEQLHQLAIPVLAKLHVGKIAFYAGPQLDVLLKAEQHYYDAYEQKQKNLNLTDSSYTKAGVSAVGGLEWTFKYRFGIDVRYVFGLSNRASDKGASLLTFPSNQRITINAIQAGLYFRFGKKPAKP
ncbi:hypothetical protein A3860_33820 [Niastella vici]|uniref:Outer membrane protein beta-barrel domain-containing protein n=1 Tax=Niastella vici TaxID=1703345 RepID=A0A1V9FPV3_9BACT|nr:porin family protein [Niastella vici]OQP60360.1 hypothetical protein A3860_33820 [Niastella vici]